MRYVIISKGVNYYVHYNGSTLCLEVLYWYQIVYRIVDFFSILFLAKYHHCLPLVWASEVTKKEYAVCVSYPLLYRPLQNCINATRSKLEVYTKWLMHRLRRFTSDSCKTVVWSHKHILMKIILILKFYYHVLRDS